MLHLDRRVRKLLVGLHHARLEGIGIASEIGIMVDEVSAEVQAKSLTHLSRSGEFQKCQSRLPFVESS